MIDPIRKFVMTLCSRGVSLEVREGKLQCRAPRGRGINLSESEKRFIADHAPLIKDFLNPDETLPDDLAIPKESVARNVVDIKKYIDAQRKQQTRKAATA